MKKIILIFSLLFFCRLAYASDIVLSIDLTIPSEEAAYAVQCFTAIYPNEDLDEFGEPIYTDAQWVKEKIRLEVDGFINPTLAAGAEKLDLEDTEYVSRIDVSVE